MPKMFKSQMPLPSTIPQNGFIGRVSHDVFAGGNEVVSCAAFSLRKCVRIGNVPDLHSGDIVKVHLDGTVVRLWDITSLHNCLPVTNACNFRCAMCPQPPCSDNPTQHTENLRLLQLLNGDISMIGITGGEPTLFPRRLEDYFRVINDKFPGARVEILTNGSPLADFDIAKALSIAAPFNLCWCVSLHGDTASLAESIMHTPNGWDKAIQGIVNLAKLQQQIEIRVVITKSNASFLEDMATFIYRNFPFASHVAFMGQEIVGEACKNYSDIWIEPTEYAEILNRAVLNLEAMGLNVSIYNVPLCLLPKSSWKFARRSISDWKQGYVSSCEQCRCKKECCGFFMTSGEHLPKGITPQIGDWRC